MDNREAAKAYLQKDRLLHMDMLEPLGHGEAEILYAGEDGVLLYHTTGEIHMLSAASLESAGRLSAKIDAASMLVLHQPYLHNELMARFSFKHVMPCHQAAWFRSDPVLMPPGHADIRPLTADSLPQVLLHYTNISDEGYLRERMEAGMLGAYVNGELAGFIGTHTEGTMGLLEVFPPYRRQGLALALETAMMQRLLALGRIPYGQIKEGNEASLALHRKLGMEITPAPCVYWLY